MQRESVRFLVVIMNMFLFKHRHLLIGQLTTSSRDEEHFTPHHLSNCGIDMWLDE